MPKDLYLESRVMTADPVELIHILYEHALLQVAAARAALTSGDFLTRTRATSKTRAILLELEGSLDYASGGSISRNLGRLYQYMRRRLVSGEPRDQAVALAEVERLLRTLDEGWAGLRNTSSSTAASSPYMQAASESAARAWNA